MVWLEMVCFEIALLEKTLHRECCVSGSSGAV